MCLSLGPGYNLLKCEEAENNFKRQACFTSITKNLPDAMEWHCTAFWDHALDDNQIKYSKRTKDLLEKAIAIPIWLRKGVSDYAKLGDILFS